MSTFSRFLSGELVHTATSRWLDKHLAKPSGFRRARKLGAARAYVRIGRYYEEHGDPRAWERARREAFQLQRQGALGQVNRFSFPSQAFEAFWLRQGEA